MLTTLRIKNLALVSDLTLELRPGYNVITGETGAGKSILIGALGLVLGERADRTLIRSGSENCTVEAVFDVTQLKASLTPFFEESGLEACQDGQLLIKRSFSSNGTNRQFVNGSPTTLSVLSQLGEWLVDIHGPHEHQSLLHPAQQLAILDAFGKLDAARDAFAELVRRRSALLQEKTSLVVDEKTYVQQLDLLRYQVQEIAAAALSAEEEHELEQAYRRANNAAKLLQLSQAAAELLSESETSALTQAGIIGRALQELHRVDSSSESLLKQHEQVVSAMQELQAGLGHYLEKVEVDPAQFLRLEERLNLIHALKRKYGSTVAEVLAFEVEARRKLQSLEQRDAELARLNAELTKLTRELRANGQSLSSSRRKVIPQLNKAVSRQLSDLGFKQSRFEIGLESAQVEDLEGTNARLLLQGFDAIEFQFAPNPGEPLHPLRAIASSGELARVMLALKTVLATEDRVPVLVFDEVDANVGGETANAVGEKMQQIARKRQVLCITHLPQVAATASTHYVATKQVKSGRTISEITLLGPDERVTELARMLGGQSAAARQHAAMLLSS